MNPSVPVRLGNHPLFRTSDLDEAREAVTRVFCPHRLELGNHGGRLATVHNSASVSKLCLNYLDYGAAVHVEPGELSSIFVVQIPVAGRSRIICGSQEIVSTPGLASVPTPTEHLDMCWDAGVAKMIVKVDRPILERTLEEMLGYGLTDPVRFELGMDVTSSAGRGWLDLIWLLVAELERADGLLRHPVAVAHLEDALLTSLVLIQPHNYTECLRARQAPVTSKVVRQAMDVIEAHCEQALTSERIARSVGVSVRTLQKGFQRHVGCTPMAYLRDVRLRRVHDELTVSDPGPCSVTEVALDWGFFHLGRFAAAYQAKFGESPSETLRGRGR